MGMGPDLERPCPACAMPIALTRPLVICPRCDRDFTVEIRGAGAEPYRESPTVVFPPVYRPPPRGAPVRDTGSRICIVYDGRVSDEITLTRTTIVAAAAAVAL